MSPIPVNTIHDDVPFGGDYSRCGEYYTQECTLKRWGIYLEAGYSQTLTAFLVEEHLISKENIAYMITTRKALNPDAFTEPLIRIFSENGETPGKKLCNSFIGDLGRKYDRANFGVICDYITAMNCLYQ